LPKKQIDQAWARCEPRHYRRKVLPAGLFKALMLAFILELPGLREITRRLPKLSGTANFSTLSFALRSLALLMVAQEMLHLLQAQCPPATTHHLVALDAMPMTLGQGRGRACQPYNNVARGGGVLWAVWLKPPPGSCPLSQLSLMRGSWSDVKLLRAARLIAGGPVYLLDRGFFAIDLVAAWLKQGVHFIQRGALDQVHVECARSCGSPRQVDRVRVLRDEIGYLGVAGRRGPRPLVRLVWGELPSGEALILVSDLLNWGAQRLLRAYQHRYDIEAFHLQLKQMVGLAHLYSFQPRGIELQLEVVVLLVLLICMELLRHCFRHLRALLSYAWQSLRLSAGLSPTRWRPNMPSAHRRTPKVKGGEASALPNH
jgi:hypothetical protein